MSHDVSLCVSARAWGDTMKRQTEESGAHHSVIRNSYEDLKKCLIKLIKSFKLLGVCNLLSLG